MDPAKPQFSELNLIERAAVWFLRRRNAVDQPRLHRWTGKELRTIRWLETSAVILAAVSGIASGALIGGLEIWLNETITDTDESWLRWFEYWALFLGISVVISAVEIVFLYWVVLWRVARITSIAGLRLSEPQIEQVIAVGLSRSALDLPDPQEPIYGIDPFLRVPRWKLWGYAVLYRLKISATSFIVRVMLRRVLARAAVRTLIPLVAIVVYAVWNAIIINWVMTASRIRAAGPIAVQELGQRLSNRVADLDGDARRLFLEAVAEAIVRSANDHPNFVILLEQLFRELGIRPGTLDMDWDVQRESVRDLDADTQSLLLDVLQVTVMLDGRPRRRQIRFLREVSDLCGRSFDAGRLQAHYTDFFRGQGIGALGRA
ncbi:LBF_2804 family protein [Thioalkalivibrio sp.]|uniref:LBF_2804 family protein n=1 Tax=Thioalkalivibrio sp. TaxID=2093813 RepID=UPI00356932C2